MASGVYFNKFFTGLMSGTINLLSGDVKVMLMTASYTPDLVTHQYRSHITANEIPNGNGYTTGGIALSSRTLTADTTNKKVKLSAANLQWPAATISARYGVVYYNTGDPATSTLLKLIDFLALKVSGGGGNFNLTWDANGVLALDD